MNCGTFLPESANFCYKCGAQQNTPVKDSVNQKEHEKSISETSVNDFEFEKTSDNTVKIKKYVGHSKYVNIPERILISNTKTGKSKIYNVESIGNHAFSNNKEVVEIHISNSIKKIGDSAFSWCENLECVVLSEDINILEDGCFSYCKKLESINLPKNLEVIENNVFCSCEKLNKVIIPFSVKKIGKDAFGWCKKIEMLELPENLEEIGKEAFRYCENLKEITIPNKIQTIDDNLFYGCKHLKNVCLPESITSIGKEAFCFCERLKSITIPTNVITIDTEAFAYCYKLRKIVIGRNTTSIADDAFYECSSNLAIQASRGSYAELFGKKHNIQVRENVTLNEIKNIDNIEPDTYSVSYPNLGKSKEELFHQGETQTDVYGLVPFSITLPSYHEDEFEIVYTFFANEITGINSNGESRQSIIREFCSATDDDDDSYELGDEISFDLKIDNTFSLYSQKIKIILHDINKQIGVLPNSIVKLVKPLLEKKYLYHLYGKFELSTKGYFCSMRLEFNNMKYPTQPFSDDYTYYLPLEYFPKHMQKDIKRRMHK